MSTEGPAPTREADGDPGRLQVRTGRLTSDARRRLNAAERPAEPAQRQDLLLRVVAQDIGHVGGETTASPPPSTSWGAATSLAGFQVSTTGRFWVSTEGKTVRELYERCIDFGAHPNELSLTTNGNIMRGPQK
jgi:hypothetical protein